MARSHLFNHFTYLRMIIKELKESLLLFTIDLNIFEETQVIHSYKNFFSCIMQAAHIYQSFMFLLGCKWSTGYLIFFFKFEESNYAGSS